MTPQERQLVADLFERLGSLEGNKRDPEAEALIQDGLRRAPHALYALVQTTLIQDEALRNADARIQELEGGGPGASTQGGFLDNMRDVFRGRSAEGRPSVPSVGGGGGAPWQRRAPDMPPQQQPGAPAGGGSFLGTAAASAAGVIGGALLLNSFRSMFGGGGQQHGALDSQSGQASPWSGGSDSNSNLAKDAGVGDIGRSGRDTSNDRASLADTSNNDDDDSDEYEDDGDFGGDSDVA